MKHPPGCFDIKHEFRMKLNVGCLLKSRLTKHTCAEYTLCIINKWQASQYTEWNHLPQIKINIKISKKYCNLKLKQVHIFSLLYAWHVKGKIQKCHAHLGMDLLCLHPLFTYSPSPIPKLHYETIHSSVLKHISIHSSGLWASFLIIKE